MPQVETRRDQIAQFIKAFTAQHGYPPTVREMADHFDLSTTVMQRHIAKMEEEGRIVKDGPRTRRGIEYRVMW